MRNTTSATTRTRPSTESTRAGARWRMYMPIESGTTVIASTRRTIPSHPDVVVEALGAEVVGRELEEERHGDDRRHARDRREGDRERGVAAREVGEHVRHHPAGRGAEDDEPDRQRRLEVVRLGDHEGEQRGDQRQVGQADRDPARKDDDALEVGRGERQPEAAHDHREGDGAAAPRRPSPPRGEPMAGSGASNRDRSGEGGIRTLERACAPYSLSRRVPSAARPPLRARRIVDKARRGQKRGIRAAIACGHGHRHP